jgi:hypothetical protein
VVLILSASVMQSAMHFVKERELKGYFRKTEPPRLKLFTWKKWFSATFQDEMTNRINENTGFWNSMIRISNQADFSLWGITHAKGWMLGKQRYLYEEDYIHEYTGEYFIGKKVIDRKLSRLKNVADSLASYNIPLVLVFESGKASIYPEYIPGRMHPEKRSLTNYEYYISRAAAIGLPILDIDAWFQRIKDTASFPLFPRYGMHWSMYGVHLVADTLSKYLAAKYGKPMPEFKIHQMHQSGNSLWTDYDIGELLNLVCPLQPTPGGYPMVAFNKIPYGTMSALVVADSYYITLTETYGRKMFGNQEYWYYNNKLYPNQNNDPPQYVDKSDLLNKLKKRDIILLMTSEINLHSGFWNFADEAFLAFHPEIKDPYVYGIENSIRNDRDWFRFLVKKSRLQGRPLEEMISEDADYTFNSNYDAIQNKTYWDTVYHLAYDIKNNADWFAQVEKKAQKFNISTDSMLMLDAIYSYRQSKKNH